MGGRKGHRFTTVVEIDVAVDVVVLLVVQGSELAGDGWGRGCTMARAVGLHCI